MRGLILTGLQSPHIPKYEVATPLCSSSRLNLTGLKDVKLYFQNCVINIYKYNPYPQNSWTTKIPRETLKSPMKTSVITTLLSNHPHHTELLYQLEEYNLVINSYSWYLNITSVVSIILGNYRWIRKK